MPSHPKGSAIPQASSLPEKLSRHLPLSLQGSLLKLLASVEPSFDMRGFVGVPCRVLIQSGGVHSEPCLRASMGIHQLRPHT